MQDTEAVKKARGMLEFVEESVLVPEDLISRVIGRNGRMLQDIVDKTQVLKIRIEDQPENKPDGKEVRSLHSVNLNSPKEMESDEKARKSFLRAGSK